MDILKWLEGQKPKKSRSKRNKAPKTNRQRRRAAERADDADYDRRLTETMHWASFKQGTPKKVRRRPYSFRNRLVS